MKLKKHRRRSWSQLLEDERWRKKRERILFRDKYRCTECGTEGSINNPLQVHHKYYFSDYPEPWKYPDEALITLCKRCHEALHEESDPPIYRHRRHFSNQMALTPCHRCKGKGYLSEYDYYEHGICFRCGGAKYDEFFDNETYSEIETLSKLSVDQMSKLLAMKYSVSSNAKLILGKCYYYGVGVKKDYSEAVRLFRMLGEGNSIGQFFLGKCYYYGYGVPKNYSKANSCFTSGAKKNEHRCQYYLGKCYYYGYGVEKDYDKAFYWFKKAAKKHDEKAQFFLGKCYYHGRGTAMDKSKAIELLKKSSKKGNIHAKYYLKKIQ